MAEEDKVFRFEMGFQEWARKEQQKRNLQDLASAIRVAEGLMDYGFRQPPNMIKLLRFLWILWKRVVWAGGWRKARKSYG